MADCDKGWGDPNGILWPVLLRFNREPPVLSGYKGEHNVWTAEALGTSCCIGRGTSRSEAIDDARAQIRRERMMREFPAPEDVDLVVIKLEPKTPLDPPMTRRELKALKKLIDERNDAAGVNEDDDSWKPWPNTLPRSILKDIDQLVNLHEFQWRASFDLHDMAVIIAQRAYDRAVDDPQPPRKER